MREEEKYFALNRQLRIDEARAYNQLLLRQQAEYEGRGIRPGDEPDIDKKFEKQIAELKEKFTEREKSFREHAKNNRLDQFYKSNIDKNDPYGVLDIDNNSPRPPEPEADSEYISAFNKGYRLQQSAPELANTISRSAVSDDPKMQGLKDGISQHDMERDKERQPPQKIHPDIWKELNDTADDITRDQGMDREPPKDIED